MMSKSRRENQPLPTSKKRIFFVVTLAFPVVLIVSLELLLRTFNYGPNLSLFVSENIGGKSYLIMNPDMKGRYFSRVQFTPNTSNDFFLKHKPHGTIRIFCLGGSTTVGFPYGFVGSFSTFLRERLQRIFPERKIEVINLGMTATNSFTVNDIAGELLDHQPDLLIVYDGHNEFYGALGLASLESLGGSRWMVKTYLKVVHLRLFHLVKEIFQSIVSTFSVDSARPDAGTMMERLAFGQYVPYSSPKYRRCLETFRNNLEELKELCGTNGVPVVLGTQVSNMRHQGPFFSNFSPGVNPEEQDNFNRLLSIAKDHFRLGHHEQALSISYEAFSVDSSRADIRFMIAQCLDALGQKQEARVQFSRARDFDELRFRASDDFNRAIRENANNQTVFVADVEKMFASFSRDSIVGRELILEHLHPKLYGYFIMAETYVETMNQHFLLAPKQEWLNGDTINDDNLWNERSVSELDERAAQRRIEILTSSWPFTREPRTIAEFAATDTVGGIVADMVGATIGWEEAHVKAAEFYASKHEFVKALAEYRAILSQFPLSVSAHLRSAQLLLMQKNLSQAQGHLLESLKVEKTFYAYKQLGAIAVDQGNPQQAVPYFEEATTLAENLQQRSEAGYLLALSHLRMGRTQQATQILERVLATDPEFTQARDLLTRVKSAR